MDFKMDPRAQGMGHLPCARCQIAVKILMHVSPVARWANVEHKEDVSAIKKGLESPSECSETNTKREAKIVDPDDSAYDSDVESIFESISSRSSSYSDLTHFWPLRPGSTALTFSRSSSCTDLTMSSPQPNSLAQSDWEDTLDIENEVVREVELFEEEENVLEIKFDLDLHASLSKFSRWPEVPTDVSVWDPDQVFDCLAKYLVFIIFSQTGSQVTDPNPCLSKKGSPQH
ncbi:hypothetical protein N7540_000001 [Penicillium herquei]|nr:hypothetical protein N7540_000001 [Penicillium herquei]